MDILFIALCSVLTGGRSFVDMEELARDRESWFKELIPMTGGPPSHDTFNRVFQLMNPVLFEACFRAWTDQIRKALPDELEIIAADGKCCRGSGHGVRAPIEVVNAWASENRLVLGGLATEGQGHEIKGGQQLLKGLVLLTRQLAKSVLGGGSPVISGFGEITGTTYFVAGVITFGEDRNRARTKYAAANLSTLRKMTMNILRPEPSNKSLIHKQRKAARSRRFLWKLLKLDGTPCPLRPTPCSPLREYGILQHSSRERSWPPASRPRQWGPEGRPIFDG